MIPRTTLSGVRVCPSRMRPTPEGRTPKGDGEALLAAPSLRPDEAARVVSILGPYVTEGILYRLGYTRDTNDSDGSLRFSLVIGPMIVSLVTIYPDQRRPMITELYI